MRIVYTSSHQWSIISYICFDMGLHEARDAAQNTFLSPLTSNSHVQSLWCMMNDDVGFGRLSRLLSLFVNHNECSHSSTIFIFIRIYVAVYLWLTEDNQNACSCLLPDILHLIDGSVNVEVLQQATLLLNCLLDGNGTCHYEVFDSCFVRVIMSLQRCSSYTSFRSLKGSTSNYVCLFTRHLLGMHHSTLRTLSGQWLICRREPRCGQHLVAICMCHEHVGGSETERLPLRPHHACGIVYLLTSNSTGRWQHLSNAVLKLFYLTGASLNICKWLCNALPVF